MKDPEFIAELEQKQAEFDPMPGAEVQKIIAATSGVSNAVRERARQARGFQ
jgi:hypothetical protein